MKIRTKLCDSKVAILVRKLSSLLHILRGCSKGECEGILIIEKCKGYLLNL